MIIIVDDTFIDRYKFHDIEYLKKDMYQDVCKVFSIIKTADIIIIKNSLSDCNLFCNHKTLQLYNNDGLALNLEDNTKYRDALLNKISQDGIQRIEFSRGLETNYETNKIDKDLFYTNLKQLLDYYIENNRVEPKILFWGAEFEERERLSNIQQMLMQIRATRIEGFSNNRIILEGLKIIFPLQNSVTIIERWTNNQLSKNDIIREINNQII